MDTRERAAKIARNSRGRFETCSYIPLTFCFLLGACASVATLATFSRPAPPPASISPVLPPQTAIAEETLQPQLRPRIVIAETKNSESEDGQTIFFDSLEGRFPEACFVQVSWRVERTVAAFAATSST